MQGYAIDIKNRVANNDPNASAEGHLQTLSVNSHSQHMYNAHF